MMILHGKSNDRGVGGRYPEGVNLVNAQKRGAPNCIFENSLDTLVTLLRVYTVLSYIQSYLVQRDAIKAVGQSHFDQNPA
jgi:hypothetical protein